MFCDKMAIESIDYSGLNRSLQPKKKIEAITADIAKAIGNVFLDWAGDSNTVKQNRLNALSDQVSGWEENMKVRLAFYVNYLSTQWLLNPWLIKWLTEDEINGIRWANGNEKIQYIIDYIVSNGRREALTSAQQSELSKSVMDWMQEYYREVGGGDTTEGLESRVRELNTALVAAERESKISQEALLERRWTNSGIIKVWKSIKKTLEDDRISNPLDKDRKILWLANSYAISGEKRRFDWTNRLPRKMDPNEEYPKAIANIKVKLWDVNTKKDEKVILKYIAVKANESYSDYKTRTMVSDSDMRRNMEDINRLMTV